MDTEFLELGGSREQVLRHRPAKPHRGGKDFRQRLVTQRHVAPGLTVHRKGQRPSWPIHRHHVDEPPRKRRWHHAHLTPDQLVQFGLEPGLRQTVDHAPALPAPVERHHYPRRILAAAIAIVPAEAEPPVPAPRHRLLRHLERRFRLPDQRAIAEQPERPRRPRPQHLGDDLRIVLVGRRPKPLDQLRPRIRHLATQQRNVPLRKPHLPGHRPTPSPRHPRARPSASPSLARLPPR